MRASPWKSGPSGPRKLPECVRASAPVVAFPRPMEFFRSFFSRAIKPRHSAGFSRCGTFGWRSGLPLRGFWVAQRFTAAIHTLPSPRLQPLRSGAKASDIVPQALKRGTYITAIGTSGTRALPDTHPTFCHAGDAFSKIAIVGFGKAWFAPSHQTQFSKMAIVGFGKGPT